MGAGLDCTGGWCHCGMLGWAAHLAGRPGDATCLLSAPALAPTPFSHPTARHAGQFGTRLQGGKDAASPRYIFTRLAPLTRHLFNEHDDRLLAYLTEEGQSIEPEW